MFAHIEGTVAEKSKDILVLDVGGVGFELSVSASTLSAAPAAGEKMKCYTVFSVREDAMELFGFATREEKRMFLQLKGVNGIGPRLAMQILSAIKPHDLSLALVAGDAAALARAPGVGKKLAQRLILELKDKVTAEELTGAPSSGPVSIVPTDPAGEAIEALMALGYQASEAARAVSHLSPMPETADEIIFMALKGMSK